MNTATIGDLNLTGDFQGNMSTSSVESASCLFNDGVIGNLAVTGYASIDELRPAILWPYHGGSNGSLRWMGIGSNISQNHTSSSDAYKKSVKDVNLEKSVFNRLDPIWFHYRKDHPFKDRWMDDSFEVYEDPESIGRMGFSYEQMLEVAPHWAYEADGMKAIGFDAMLPDFMAWTVAAIKDLRTRVLALEM